MQSSSKGNRTCILGISFIDRKLEINHQCCIINYPCHSSKRKSEQPNSKKSTQQKFRKLEKKIKNCKKTTKVLWM